MWFLSDPARFKKEKDALDALAAQPWLSSYRFNFDPSGNALGVEADLLVGAAVRGVRVVYPPMFPTMPPYVLPRERERWSAHQYGAGGELCLELRPDNWTPDKTAADMLASANKLLSVEDPEISGVAAGEVPNAHRTTLGQQLRNATWRLLATEGFAEVVGRCSTVARAKFGIVMPGGSVVLIPLSVEPHGAEPWTEYGVPKEIREGLSRSGYAIAIADGDPRGGRLDQAVSAGASTLRALVGITDEQKAEGWETLVVSHGGRTRAFNMGGADAAAFELGVADSRSETRLPSRSRELAKMRFAIVGCGSVGSKVASMLARSGVGGFLLVDDDVMLPENLSRNELTWRDVGGHKVEALRDHLQLVNGAADVAVIRQQIGGQEAAQTLEATAAKIAGCDIIVDASGNDDAFNYLAGIARGEAIPMSWGRVFAGGYGGFVARSRPSIDPSPAYARAAINAFWNRPELPDPPRAARAYEAVGVSDGPMIADDADVGVLAAHLTRLSLDTATAPTDSSFECSAYAIGLRKEWIFSAAFETFPIDLGPPAAPVDATLLGEEEQAIVDVELFKIFEALAKARDD